MLLRAIEKKLDETNLKELPFLTPDNSLSQNQFQREDLIPKFRVDTNNALSILLKEKNHRLIY